jgi:hypothetical protein
MTAKDESSMDHKELGSSLSATVSVYWYMGMGIVQDFVTFSLREGRKILFQFTYGNF